MVKKRKRIGEPFPLPLFCPECFEPLGPDNAMLFPTTDNDSGVGCQNCWTNPLCPGHCNGVHGAPIPRGARRNLRPGSVPGTWTCPTTEQTYNYVGPNNEVGWNSGQPAWSMCLIELVPTYLNPNRTEWFESENEWHDSEGHEYCDTCEQYVEDMDSHYDDYHYRDDDYDDYDDDYEPRRDNRPIGQWSHSHTHYHPITEETAEFVTAPKGWLPIPTIESRVAA